MSNNENSNLDEKNFVFFAKFNPIKLKKIKKNRYWNAKLKFWIGIFGFLFLGLLIIVVICDITDSSKSLKTKTKRFVKSNETDFRHKNKALRHISWNKLTSNIHIAPGWDPSNRKIDEHPNHRYSELEPTGKIFSELHSESEWAPISFNKNLSKQFNSNKDIASKEFKDQNLSSKTSLAKFKKNELKGFEKMILKGVILRPDDKYSVADQNKEFSDNYLYLKEINELMQSKSNDSDYGKKRSLKKAFKGQGSAFQAPTKGPDESYQTSQSKINNSWIKKNIKKYGKKPISILLEIYPMKSISNNLEKNWLIRKIPKNMFFVSKNYKMVVPVISLLPDKKEERKLLMKLNLYPKKIKYESNRELSDVYLGNNERAYERIFQRIWL